MFRFILFLPDRFSEAPSPPAKNDGDDEQAPPPSDKKKASPQQTKSKSKILAKSLICTGMVGKATGRGSAFQKKTSV